MTLQFDPAPSAQRAVPCGCRCDGLLSTIRNTAASLLGFGHQHAAGVDLHNAEPGLQAWLEPGASTAACTTYEAHGPQARVNWPNWFQERCVSSPHAWIICLQARRWTGASGLCNGCGSRGEAVISLLLPGGGITKRDACPAAAIGRFHRTKCRPHRLSCSVIPRFGASGLASHAAHQGWRGRHTLLLNREAGSTFFLGEIFTDCHFPTQPCAWGPDTVDDAPPALPPARRGPLYTGSMPGVAFPIWTIEHANWH